MQTGEEAVNGKSEVRAGPVTRRQKSLVNGTSNPPSDKSQRRATGSVIDVSKLKTMSLRKYIRLYNLREVPPYSTRVDLCEIVTEHLDSMIIDEDQVLTNLVERLRNENHI